MTNEWQSSAADSVDKQSQCGNNENAQKHKSVQMCDLKKKKKKCGVNLEKYYFSIWMIPVFKAQSVMLCCCC